MPLFCADGTRGVFVARGAPSPKPRGLPWSPPDLEPDRCQRETCRRLAMDHSTLGFNHCAAALEAHDLSDMEEVK